MPAVSRTLLIEYGSLTLGGASEYLLNEEFLLSSGLDRLRLVFRVVIAEASAAAMMSLATALEDEFAIPHQDIVINLAGQIETYKNGDNTAFNIAPSWRKTGRYDSDKSREYECTIEADIPYVDGAAAPKIGLREFSLEVTAGSNNRRVLTISGLYDARPGGLNGRASYDAQIDALETTSQNKIDAAVDWEPKGRNSTEDVNDKKVRFRSVFEERIHRQSLGIANVPEINEQELIIETSNTAPGDYTRSPRPTDVSVSFSADIDKDLTTDLKSVWEKKILPAIIAQIKTDTGASKIAITRIAPRFDHDNNTIEASLSGIAITRGDVMSSSVRIEESEPSPARYAPVWDGSRHAKFILPIAGALTRTVSQTYTVHGNKRKALKFADAAFDFFGTDPFTGPGNADKFPGGAVRDAPEYGGTGGAWFRFGRPNVGYAEIYIGLEGPGSPPGGNLFLVTSITIIDVRIYVVPQINSGGNTGGGGT